MKIATILTASWLVATPALAGQGIVKETLESAGAPRTYYLYVPEHLPENAKVPLLLTFHGSGRDGRSLVEKWTQLADRKGFIVAGLDSKDKQYWAVPEDGPDLVKALVDRLQARYPVDSSRLYLFGHSAGAVFALKMGLMESEYFAAVAVHAGSFRQQDEYTVIRMATRKIPLKVIIGDRDAFFPLATATATADALKAHGFTVDLEVVKRHDHWYYDRAQQFNESAWSFLKDQRLAGEPNFLQYKFPGP
jgi:poly(3-hydroxybutyrate) depolymerase